ncbi:MAG TPA: sulfatase-like hydrolase/transferase [Micropepsaceae bacterium]|nr:sulfatase-like hydrolase/transferase [Micropepsaceae bacterium]
MPINLLALLRGRRFNVAMTKIRNILFIMSDQLRWDHVSAFNPDSPVRTPNIDALAARGVRFTNAFCQSGVCGPSRISFYTGRYPSSHGVTWNSVPLSVQQRTLGEYLRPLGLRVALCGKSHVVPDMAGLERLGIDPASPHGVLLRQGGFEPFDRHEGHVAPPADSAYNNFLRANGYDAENPWEAFANSALDENGECVSGWWMRNAHLPARVKKEHSETAYHTDRALTFMDEMGEKPWALHLSYIKPHWPMLAPAPYHAMHDGKGPINRTVAERDAPHPVLAAYRAQEECVTFARDEVIERVRACYRGLVSELDDNLGRLWREMQARGRDKDTLIVFTADHGDFLGDHYLGEKEIMFDDVMRIPLIIVDPSPEADATRGAASTSLVESIDLIPTFLDALNGDAHAHLLEGVSLLPALRDSKAGTGRSCAVAELDYGFREARRMLRRHPRDCRAVMIRTHEWKYVWWQDFPPQLFNLHLDPAEQNDLGIDPSHARRRAEMEGLMHAWRTGLKLRLTASDAYVEAHTNTHRKRNIHIGIW